MSTTIQSLANVCAHSVLLKSCRICQNQSFFVFTFMMRVRERKKSISERYRRQTCLSSSRIQNFYDPESTRFVNGPEARSLEYSNRTAALVWSDLMLESNSGSKYNVSQKGVQGTSAYFQNTFRNEVDISQSNISGVLNGWA